MEKTETRGRPKGLPRTGGRVKGTPNRNNLLIIEELKQHGVNPVLKILELLPKVSDEKQIDTWMRLMAFCYPQFRQVEVSGHINSITVTPDNVAQLCAIAREKVVNDIIIDSEDGQLSPSDTAG